MNEAVAIDLACGGGRDAVFIANRNWGKVIAVDYLSEQLVKTKQLATYNKVESSIELVERDLEKDGLPLDDLANKCHLATVSRYLHRPHFADLPRLLAPGGFLVFHTFMKGCENTAVGRPKRPQFLLNPNELATVFGSENGFKVIRDEIFIITDGRPTSFFVAQKQ